MALCGGDLDKTFSVTTFDKNSKRADDEMGSFETTVNEMIVGSQGSGIDYTLTIKGKSKGDVYVRVANISGYQAPSITAAKNMAAVGAAKICKLEVDRKDEAAKVAAQVVAEAEAAIIEARAAAEVASLAFDEAKAAADTAAATVDAL
mmetsp:Transcript_36121/g.36350  ORF Transcript_36121/g.36350 Transcript_36121/m.36350 type:complete len:148 (+) Transcript_36121:157-600(+)